MLHIRIPWSQVHVPGITAQVVPGPLAISDPVVAVAPGAAPELLAAFMAFCGSWQQGDQQGCALVAPLLARHGVAPLPLAGGPWLGA